MAAIALTVYVQVSREDWGFYERLHSVPMRHLRGGRYYVGLREHKADARQRAEHNHVGPAATNVTHGMLKIEFTYAGMAYYCTRFAGREFRYAQFLCKMTYEDISRDWGVWHFHGDEIQFGETDPATGMTLVRCSLEDLE